MRLDGTQSDIEELDLRGLKIMDMDPSLPTVGQPLLLRIITVTKPGTCEADLNGLTFCITPFNIPAL